MEFTKKILIAENAPSWNKGEMAIALGLCEIFGADCHFQMLSYYPEYDRPRYGGDVEMIDVRPAWPMIRDAESGMRFAPSLGVALKHAAFAVLFRLFGMRVLKRWTAGLWRAYAEADIIAFGHDSSFGAGGEPENPLFYPLYLPHFARFLGKRVVFSAGSIPKPPRRFTALFSWLFRKAAEAAHVVTLREDISFHRLMSFGYRKLVAHVTADPAYVMPPAPPSRIDAVMLSEGVPQTAPLIAMTASAVRARIAYPDKPADVSYRAHMGMMACIVDDIVRTTGATVMFVGHTTGHDGAGDDRDVARDIRNLCEEKTSVVIINGEYTPPELKGIIGRCTMLVGERLHSVIAAASQDVPAIAISYRADTRLGMVLPAITDEFVFALEDLQPEPLLNKIRYVLDNRDAVVAALRARSAAMREKARLNRILLEDARTTLAPPCRDVPPDISASETITQETSYILDAMPRSGAR